MINTPQTSHSEYHLEEAIHKEKPRARWLSCEFFIYYALILFAAYKITFSGWKVSSPISNPNFDKLEHLLSRGWMGPFVDNSDAQFAAFRNNFLNLTLMMGIFCLLSLGLKALKRESYLFLAGLVVLLALHGLNSVFIISFMLVNYYITFLGQRYFPKLIPILTWSWALLSLVGLEWIGNQISFTNLSWGYLSFLDRNIFKGAYHRWWIIYNISVLRMISFNLDYYYALISPRATSSQTSIANMKHIRSCAECQESLSYCGKIRSTTSLELDSYNVCNYFSYLLYTPLFLSGPIITFNNFCCQLKAPILISSKYKAWYLIRLLISILVMEWIMHNFYVVAIKNMRAWDGFSTLDMFCIGYLNLKLIWLKLLIIWRFARFWALVDGIDAPENMIRCMSNNYSGLAFWRSWHRSFNQWIVRYIYIPLGGSQYATLNIWVIFTFVAIWHDRTLSLLVWGWLISLFIAPELILAYLSKMLNAESWNSYRIHAGIAGAFNLYLMSIANLVGFCVGVDGVMIILKSALSYDGVVFLCWSFITAYAAVQIMFEIREQEYRSLGVMKNY
ncbi:glycerol transporter [Mitosporidium daphniae]